MLEGLGKTFFEKESEETIENYHSSARRLYVFGVESSGSLSRSSKKKIKSETMRNFLFLQRACLSDSKYVRS